MKIDLMLK